jgi:hypothetical protein
MATLAISEFKIDQHHNTGPDDQQLSTITIKYVLECAQPECAERARWRMTWQGVAVDTIPVLPPRLPSVRSFEPHYLTCGQDRNCPTLTGSFVVTLQSSLLNEDFGEDELKVIVTGEKWMRTTMSWIR